MDPESDWLLFEGPAEGSQQHLASLEGKASGTLVLWEKLDRIVTTGYTVDDYLALTVAVEAHLAMVFHRLLQGSRARIKLLINNHAIKPWNPFMSGHPAKPWTSPPASMRTDSGLVLALESWVGPLNAVRDFEIGTGAIEVKTTISAVGFPAKIGSLEQLDDSARQPLFLAGVRLRQGETGQNLSELVADIRDIAAGEAYRMA